MKTEYPDIPGVVLIDLDVHRDERGFFVETYHAERYAEAGIEEAFVQDNRSQSARGVLRGLHYQYRRPQGHLVTVTRGEIYDVGLDLRRGSPAFGRWFGTRLSARSARQLYLPPGVAHGFCVLSEVAEISYKCTDYYDPEGEAGVLWCDPDVGIPWPVDEPQISERDAGFPRMCDIPPERLP